MNTAWAHGVGLATVTDSGHTLDVWYPHPYVEPGQNRNGRLADNNQDSLRHLSHMEKADPARSVHTQVVTCSADLAEPPSSVEDAYLRLHLLSHCLVLPNSINLEGIFDVLPTVVWTSAGPCSPNNFEVTRIRLREKFGVAPLVRSVDKFPAMTDFVVPPQVRIADGATVRLGAYLSPGTTIMSAGAVNFNAGTLGHAMVEGRISQGVVIGDGSDIGGGASTMGTLSGGGTQRVKLGERCLLGANAGLGIPLGDDCVVESGLYLTAGTKVVLHPGQPSAPFGTNDSHPTPLIRRVEASNTPLGSSQEGGRVVAARELANSNGLLFRRNSLTGQVEALARTGRGIELNAQLHTAN